MPVCQPVHGMAQCLLSGQGVNGIAENQMVGGGVVVLEVCQQHRLLHRRQRIDALYGFSPCGEAACDGLVLHVRPALRTNIRGSGFCPFDFRRMVCYRLQPDDECIGQCLCLAVCPYGRIIGHVCVECATLHDAVDVHRRCKRVILCGDGLTWGHV